MCLIIGGILFSQFTLKQDRHYVSFYVSNDIAPGHAFISLLTKDITTGITLHKGAYGLYPRGYVDALRSVIPNVAGVPGAVINEAHNTAKDHGLIGFTIEIDKEEYHRIMSVIEEWKSQRLYDLIKKDCLTFMMDVADEIPGLIIPERRGLKILPKFYMMELISVNDLSSAGMN